MNKLLKSKRFRIATCVAIGVLVIALIVMRWDWLHGDGAGPSPSETLKNVGLLVAGVLALGIAIWRAKVADRQSVTAQGEAVTSKQGLQYDRYQRGAQMLGSESLSVRLAGISSLEWLAKEDLEQYHIQIMQSFCSFATNPAGTYESNRPPPDNAVNVDQATRQDVREVMYALGKRSEVGKCLERAAGLRLDLRSASLRGCDLGDMDFSNALLGGVDLSYANFTKTIFSGADLRRTIFANAKLNGTDFSGTICYKTNLSRVSGDLPNFSNSIIANSNFKDACWTRPNFREVRIASCEFTNASLKDADLSGANFSTDLSALAAQSQECGITQPQLDEARSERNKPPILNGLLDSKTLQPLIWRGRTLEDVA